MCGRRTKGSSGFAWGSNSHTLMLKIKEGRGENRSLQFVLSAERIMAGSFGDGQMARSCVTVIVRLP